MVAAWCPRSHIVRVAGVFATIKVGCQMVNIGQCVSGGVDPRLFGGEDAALPTPVDLHQPTGFTRLKAKPRPHRRI